MRRPPLLGAVGLDFGVKPAISFVITKPRKVIFSDDDIIPETCCLYPGGRTGASYPAADLPDSIDFYNAGVFIATLVHCPLCGPRTFNDTGLPIATYTIADEGDGWEYTTGFGDGGTDCLIGVVDGDDVLTGKAFYDHFTSTYTVTVTGDPSSYTVTRISICTWFGDGFTLRYDSGDFLWHLIGVAIVTGTPTVINETKVPPQNHPDGMYSGISTVT